MSKSIFSFLCLQIKINQIYQKVIFRVKRLINTDKIMLGQKQLTHTVQTEAHRF